MRKPEITQSIGEFGFFDALGLGHITLFAQETYLANTAIDNCKRIRLRQVRRERRRHHGISVPTHAMTQCSENFLRRRRDVTRTEFTPGVYHGLHLRLRVA